MRKHTYEKDGKTVYGLAFTREEIDYPDTNAASSNRVPRLSRTVLGAPMTQRCLRRRFFGHRSDTARLFLLCPDALSA